MIDYDENYFSEDDVMPFEGWHTVTIPWSNLKRCHARIRVRGEWDGCDLFDITTVDVDWLELHTVDGFRQGRIEAYDGDDDEAEALVRLFDNLPTETQREALAGATLADIDDREIVIG